ncbi:MULTISPECIES: ArsR/SmtB family transcription factor [unclassified Agarivorans]|uniref:ArsR/SmtB family transcription factor n=1 Tax=unclassified Agarivorans TaxID=2636026 RepID=UPI0010EA9CB9|nr:MULTISPECIES: metalloregulator ArsR/SmtB family transcription factor [unclassified Agarivorans]MDO6686571.1 metalloregulator ArsR/SmtB family transcription factor [Agarivorans sp. 3_MG-2023]MDO6715389.1 metalloregulator ArsR/SmtB family transcription factor [Agarivorans sp. 2_MG-2023]MDO6763294.1 metalloregulator ArsR/SmtB family transcription factor [Agarivorans sp. 1_MG-2023]GDY26921.1 transcriptional regulator [Agarivorans sp. Toyoura001]
MPARNELHEQASMVSEYLKTIAHPDRLVVLCLLREGEMSVGELRQHSQNSQSAFSQHLKVLREQGLVAVRKQAQTVFYCIADPKVKTLLAGLQQQFCSE